MTIGFIGLGAMGLPMAKPLLEADQPLVVWNRGSAPVQTLVAGGAIAASAPVEAAKVDILISMLADDQAVRDVLIDGGVLAHLPVGAIHVNMATVSVAFAKELQALHEAAGVGYVAAPVLGRVDVAAAGNLNILVAGKPDHLARVRPLLALMGQKIWHFGDEPAQANAVKIAANFTIACAIESISEASALVRSHGIGAPEFVELLTQTLYPSPVYKGYGGMIAQERYAPAGFKLSLGLKDVRLALQAGEAKDLPLPFASVLRDSHLEALAHGDGALDWAALAKVSARRGNLN